MTWQSILTSLNSLAVVIAAAYVAFYFRGLPARREQIAKALANFYASAACAYYALRKLPDSDSESDQKYLTFYKLFDDHYKEFLSSSTVLASLVHPALRDEVLGVEDIWDEINDKGFATVSEKKWFDSLDSIRARILDSISYSRLTDPFWKRVRIHPRRYGKTRE